MTYEWIDPFAEINRLNWRIADSYERGKREALRTMAKVGEEKFREAIEAGAVSAARQYLNRMTERELANVPPGQRLDYITQAARPRFDFRMETRLDTGVSYAHYRVEAFNVTLVLDKG